MSEDMRNAMSDDLWAKWAKQEGHERQQPIFSICHTSARPAEWRKAWGAWIALAKHPELVEYVLTCAPGVGFEKDWPQLRPQDKVFWDTDPRRCFVGGANLACAASTGRVLIIAADDIYPPQNWDQQLLELIPDLGADFVIQTASGTPADARDLMVLAIQSRTRYEKHGYGLYPEYESMYSDDDFSEHARADGIVIEARHLLFEHRHPLYSQGFPMDEVYQRQNSEERYAQGRAILERRRAAQFDDAKGGKKVFACVLPGETFSQAWVGAWTEILSNLVQHFHVNVQFGFASNVYYIRQAQFDALKHVSPRPDYILWLDDDQILTLEALQHLIRDLEEHPELDGVVGWAWCEGSIYSSGNRMLSCGVREANGKPTRLAHEKMMAAEGDLILISYSGFPAVVMRGRVLDQVGPRAFMPIFDEELFPPYGMSGEDVAFFLHAADAGLKFAVDRRVMVPHLKLRCAEPVLASSLEGAAK